MDSFSVRTAPRETLTAELNQAAADRESHGKLHRAADARRAIAELEDGAETVFYERVYYCVGEPGREAIVRRQRHLVAAELRESVEGWAHFGKDRLAAEAKRALTELESGADRVQVGHIVYDVRA